MTFTSTDLIDNSDAIKSGAETIRTADGKLVTLRPLPQLLQARQAIRAEIAATSATARPYPRHQLADFSD